MVSTCASLRRCAAAPLRRCAAAPLRRCAAAPLRHCATVPLSPRSPFRLPHLSVAGVAPRECAASVALDCRSSTKCCARTTTHGARRTVTAGVSCLVRLDQPEMISFLGSFQNDLGSFWNDLNHVTLRRSVLRPRRPDRAGWLRRRPRTDGRVEVCAKPVPTLAEPRTFEQCVLKEEHSHQAFGQWRRHRPDVQSGLPSTTLDHLSATQQPPI